MNKPETRNPKHETNPKIEIRNFKVLEFEFRALEFVSNFDIRDSGL